MNKRLAILLLLVLLGIAGWAAIHRWGWPALQLPRAHPAQLAPVAAPATPIRFEASPGTFYLLDRVAIGTAGQVRVLQPGDRVMLMERLPKGQVRVSVGGFPFTVEQSQLTDDLEAARAARDRARP